MLKYLSRYGTSIFCIIFCIIFSFPLTVLSNISVYSQVQNIENSDTVYTIREIKLKTIERIRQLSQKTYTADIQNSKLKIIENIVKSNSQKKENDENRQIESYYDILAFENKDKLISTSVIEYQLIIYPDKQSGIKAIRHNLLLNSDKLDLVSIDSTSDLNIFNSEKQNLKKVKQPIVTLLDEYPVKYQGDTKWQKEKQDFLQSGEKNIRLVARGAVDKKLTYLPPVLSTDQKESSKENDITSSNYNRLRSVHYAIFDWLEKDLDQNQRDPLSLTDAGRISHALYNGGINMRGHGVENNFTQWWYLRKQNSEDKDSWSNSWTDTRALLDHIYWFWDTGNLIELNLNNQYENLELGDIIIPQSNYTRDSNNVLLVTGLRWRNDIKKIDMLVTQKNKGLLDYSLYDLIKNNSNDYKFYSLHIK
jgi:hypothetical protein